MSMSKSTPYRRSQNTASRYSLSGGHIPADAGGLRPPVTLRPEPQAAASKQAKTIIPLGVKVQVCHSPAYAKAPPDTKVVRRAGAPAVYTGRISE